LVNSRIIATTIVLYTINLTYDKKLHSHFFRSCSFLCSCGSDAVEEGLTPVMIQTNADTATLSQNSSIEVFIFQNDSNIPTSGSLSLSAPSKGAVSINTNGTPNDPSDDSVTFTASPNITGEDTFNYTVCDDANMCYEGQVSISILSLSTVNYDLANYPLPTLSEYNFFQGDLKDLNPTFGVLPYTLNSKLFTDYAKKKRFV